MAGAKKPELVVLVPLAYATRVKGSEVRMLTKGTVVDPSEYTEASISHLKEIGFLGSES